MDVLQGLLAAILEDPHDPGPRLILADWMSEQGLENSQLLREEKSWFVQKIGNRDEWFLCWKDSPYSEGQKQTYLAFSLEPKDLPPCIRCTGIGTRVGCGLATRKGVKGWLCDACWSFVFDTNQE